MLCVLALSVCLQVLVLEDPQGPIFKSLSLSSSSEVQVLDSAGLRLWRPWCTQKNEAPCPNFEIPSNRRCRESRRRGGKRNWLGVLGEHCLSGVCFDIFRMYKNYFCEIMRPSTEFRGPVQVNHHHHHYSACTISVRSSACYQVSTATYPRPAQ